MSCVFLGWSVSLKFNLFDSLAKRFAFALLFGLLVESTAFLAVSWLTGLFSAGFVFLGSLVFLAVSFIFLGHDLKPVLASLNAPLYSSNAESVAIAFVIMFAFLNQAAVLHSTPSGVESVISVWGDYPFHMAVSTSFLSGNFPPEYPILAGEPLKYSFLVNYSSALLQAGGLDVRSSFVLLNVLIFLSLAFGLVMLCGLFSKKTIFVLFAFCLLFLNGNYGIAFALQDALASPSVLAVPQVNYSNFDSAGVVLMNWLYSVFLPQRSALLGIAASVFIYFILLKNFRQKYEKKELALAGVMMGLLPLAHAHSFLAVGVISAVMFLFDSRGRIEKWAWFVTPAFILALPQMIWLWGKATISVNLGWMAEPKTIFGVIDFWIKNGWGALLLAIPGFFLLDSKQKRFAIGFIALFVLANVFSFQAWAWDNSKIFLHFFLFAAIASALLLEKIFNFPSKTFKRFAKPLCLLLLAISIASGVLTVFWVAWGDNARYQAFSSEDFALAEWVKQNTPPYDVFLTSQDHLNPVASLAGRKILAGYEGWLWSHGLDYHKRQADSKSMFSTGNCALFEFYGVKSIFVKASENSFAFQSSPNFALAYSDSLGNRVFRVNCVA